MVKHFGCSYHDLNMDVRPQWNFMEVPFKSLSRLFFCAVGLYTSY